MRDENRNVAGEQWSRKHQMVSGFQALLRWFVVKFVGGSRATQNGTNGIRLGLRE